MKLITKEIERKLAKNPLYSGEKKSPEEREVLVKFFYPYGRGTWYVLEAEKDEDGDWLFFGLVDLHERELGYFRLSELQSVRKFGRPAIERDKWYGKHTLAEVQAGDLSAS